MTILKSFDAPLKEVNGPRAALEYLENFSRIDLVICALHDKGKGGINLLAKARKLGHRVPFLLLPLRDSSHLLKQALQHRLVQCAVDGMNDDDWKAMVQRGVDVGRTFRSFHLGLLDLCRFVQLPAEKIEELEKLQEKFLIQQLGPRLFLPKKAA